MSKYIKLEDAIKTLYKWRFGGTHLIEDVMRDLPAIDIVHCRDCQYNNHETICEIEENWCEIFKDKVASDDFCSYGEKLVTDKLNNTDDSLLTEDPEDCKEKKGKLDVDTISRQAAIRAICQECNPLGYDECSVDCAEAEALRKLPPTAPVAETVTSADDCISWQAAINAIENTDVEITAEEWDELTDAIESLSPVESRDKDAISREGLLKSWEELSPRGRTEFDQVIMTIPALPLTEPTPVCEDAISRQALIDEVLEDGNGAVLSYTKGMDEDELVERIEKQMIEYFIKVIEYAPPVEPRPAYEDAISRQATIEEIEERFFAGTVADINPSWRLLHEIVESLPPVEPVAETVTPEEDCISRQAALELIRAQLQDWVAFGNTEYRHGLYVCEKLIKSLPPIEDEDMGEAADRYHTFNQLYYQRAVLFATIVNQNKDKAWKSWKHEDGQFCFDKGGEWFIVGIDTPEGSYTYHYEKKYWDMFDCEDIERGKHWDGHTEEDVTRLLTLAPVELVCEDTISRQAAIAYAISGSVRTLPTSEDGENWIRTSEVRQSLLTMPSAQPQRPKGEWYNDTRYSGWTCTNCRYHDGNKTDKFCPNCGAVMRGDEE